MIPKLLHLIWVGDEAKRPHRAMQSWRDLHPDWEIRIWGNEDLVTTSWINQGHLSAMARQEWNGVADMMRWEILFRHGGVLVDADSVCVRSLPEWLLECEAFACWEHELLRPGLIAAGYFGSLPKTPFLAALIQGIHQKATVTDRNAWESVGPLYLTEMWRKLAYDSLTVLPSHFFIPHHFAGLPYSGGGPVFAEQLWGSTLGSYSEDPGEAEASQELHSQVFLVSTAGDWMTPLRAFLRVFRSEEPVALLVVPERFESRDAHLAHLGAVLEEVGSANLPEVRVVGSPEELATLLGRHPKWSWVRENPGERQGFSDPAASRLAAARVGLVGDRGETDS